MIKVSHLLIKGLTLLHTVSGSAGLKQKGGKIKHNSTMKTEVSSDVNTYSFSVGAGVQLFFGVFGSFKIEIKTSTDESKL